MEQYKEPYELVEAFKNGLVTIEEAVWWAFELGRQDEEWDYTE